MKYLNDKYLPIGTVVTLKNGSHRIMITGFTSMGSDSGIVYDYVGCPYPEGFTSCGNMLYFYGKDIEKIDHIMKKLVLVKHKLV